MRQVHAYSNTNDSDELHKREHVANKSMRSLFDCSDQSNNVDDVLPLADFEENTSEEEHELATVIERVLRQLDEYGLKEQFVTFFIWLNQNLSQLIILLSSYG